jgi:hypothetical protein
VLQLEDAKKHASLSKYCENELIFRFIHSKQSIFQKSALLRHTRSSALSDQQLVRKSTATLQLRKSIVRLKYPSVQAQDGCVEVVSDDMDPDGRM